MTARELFEKSDYVVVCDTSDRLTYEKYYHGDEKFVIVFLKNYQTYVCYSEYAGLQSNLFIDAFTHNLIYNQLKEFGWLEPVERILKEYEQNV